MNKGDFAKMNVGDVLFFTNSELGFERRIERTIKNISYYDNFQTYLEKETLENCLPGVESIKDGLNVYFTYYTPSDEFNYKIKAFTF